MIMFLVILVIIAADQVSKYLIVNSISYGDLVPVINNFFYITYHENKGAAWGIFQNGRYFFIAIGIIILIILFYFLIKSKNKLLKVSLSFLMGGAVGNLTDRIVRGSVVDFLDFYFGSYNFPTFNIADSFIVIGTILLAFYMFFIYKEGPITG